MDDLISRSAVIDRVAEFLSPKGLDEWEVMVAIREIIENVSAIDAVPVDRLGDFGKLFMEYKGCPRGAMGRMGGTPIEEEVLYMKPITDVDGGRWVPVNADALQELVLEYKKRAPVVRCLKCVWRSEYGLCYKHGHGVRDDFFCAYGTTEMPKRAAKKDAKQPKKTEGANAG